VASRHLKLRGKRYDFTVINRAEIFKSPSPLKFAEERRLRLGSFGLSFLGRVANERTTLAAEPAA
jgi:hypothetical protein